MDNNLQYLGVAIKWPIEVNSLGQISTESGVNLIIQSVLRHLECPLGTEFFNEDIGSRINLVGYEPNDFLLQNLLDIVISEAVANEPRVEYVRTIFSSTDSLVRCQIFVSIKESSEIIDFTWDYYPIK